MKLRSNSELDPTSEAAVERGEEPVELGVRDREARGRVDDGEEAGDRRPGELRAAAQDLEAFCTVG